MNEQNQNFNMDDLAHLILTYRQAKNIKQIVVGTAVDLSQKQISMIETSQVNLKLATFLKIAEVLEINPCDLLAQAGLLKEFPPCEKSKQIEQLIEENKTLKATNQMLQKLLGLQN